MKSKTLSMAGRVVLTKFSLEALPTHIMSYIILFVQITNSIDKTSENFIWGSTYDRNKMHLINWDSVTKSKTMGDLDCTDVVPRIGPCMAYTHICGNDTPNSISSTNFSRIWDATLSNKLKTFLWTLEHRKMPTHQLLHTRGVNVSPSYKVYNHECEDIDHVFSRCKIAQSF